MKCTFLFVCLLTFAAVWNFISSVDIRFRKYEFVFEGYRCIPNETAFEYENISDSYKCSKLCHVNNACLSFSYKPDSYQCIGCRVNLGIRPSSYESYPGSLYFHTKTETSCKEISENNRFVPSGQYKIRLSKSKKVQTVYCDMDTDGGGWTVFQHRFDHSLYFNRTFSEYESGFGALNGEFWLGLKTVQEMTYQVRPTLRLDVRTDDDMMFTETYQNFYLDKGPRYTLRFGEQVNDVGSEGYLKTNKNQHFSTYDVDQDSASASNCARNNGGGWWYNACTWISLNRAVRSRDGMLNIGTYGHTGKYITTSKMMFR
ncbi:fibrinogen-like protein A [Mercenaria mercenaria]|uniref:fibrinogen-like protein A n=1 Tax=Mercenaria mercenaria TaxID=6596 RepID=UPI00234F43FD|nr:fibrinogen-like protein A [Mercenaria mercenaria]